MKIKKITSLGLITILFSVLSSCKGPGNVVASNCDDLSNDYSAKITAFSSDPSKASCTAWVTSLNNLVNKCTILTAAQRKQYNDSLAGIDCNDF